MALRRHDFLAFHSKSFQEIRAPMKSEPLMNGWIDQSFAVVQQAVNHLSSNFERLEGLFSGFQLGIKDNVF